MRVVAMLQAVRELRARCPREWRARSSSASGSRRARVRGSGMPY